MKAAYGGLEQVGPGVGRGEPKVTLQALSFFFFSTAVYLLNFNILKPSPSFMNRMISVSIDEEAQAAYDSIPRGQRSLRIRELLKDAGALSVSEREKVTLRIEVRLWRTRSRSPTQKSSRS